MPVIQPPIFNYLSLAKIASGCTPTNPTGSFTSGHQFWPTEACLCIGVRFYAIVSGTKAYKVSLWDNSGTRLANATANVTATGVQEILFSSAQSLSPNVSYRVSMWQTDGGNYEKCVQTTMTAAIPAIRYFDGWKRMVQSVIFFGTGDTFPNTSAGTEAYPVDPILI